MDQEQSSVNPIPTRKIYKDKAIWAGTFLGGPLVAGYLIAENFKTFNEPNNAKKTWVYSILTTIAIFASIFLIPDMGKFPEQSIPLVYTAIAYFFVQHYQSAKIASHINSGGQTYNGWRVLSIGLVGLVIIILPIIGITYLTDPVANLNTKSYGNLKHEVSFDKSNLNESEADRIANSLTLANFFDQAQQKFILASKIGNTYEISIPVENNSWENPEAISSFRDLRKGVQSFFHDYKIVINMCKDDGTVKKRLE